MEAAARVAPGPPGAQLLAEIREQPAALRRLLEHAGDYAAVATQAVRRGSPLVRMVGHGSSDNAASYGVYAFGLLPGWTALRDSISLSVYYGAQVDVRGSGVIGLSQSGQTPDVLDYVERARARGALTIAITNEPELRPRRRRRGSASARRRLRARDRGDEDLHEPGGGARPPRGLRGRPRIRAGRRHRAHRRPAR